jgi:cephalosporin hydroxylase
MPLLPTSVRRRLRDKALAASRRLSTGPEWERHVRDEFGLLAPAEGWRDDVAELTYVVASSTDHDVVAQVAERAERAGPVLVVLDSDHSRDHVLAELRAYAPLVTPGSYLVVEDTNINGHPVYEAFGPGPMEAVQDFLKERDDFEVDRSREKFLFSFNPGGWLRKRG